MARVSLCLRYIYVHSILYLSRTCTCAVHIKLGGMCTWVCVGAHVYMGMIMPVFYAPGTSVGKSRGCAYLCYANVYVYIGTRVYMYWRAHTWTYAVGGSMGEHMCMYNSYPL